MLNVNPHDTVARFKAALELAEREARRQEREARRQEREKPGPVTAIALLRRGLSRAAPGDPVLVPHSITISQALRIAERMEPPVRVEAMPSGPVQAVRVLPVSEKPRRVVAADANPKHAAGRAKPAMRHVPPSALFALGAVMAGGATRYGAYNWCEAGVSATVYYDAAMRHLAAWLQGADRDPESGEHPLAHAMACCAIVLDAHALGVLADDRPKATAHPFAALGRPNAD